MLQASSDSDVVPLTLVNIPFDLQVTICTLLHPFDIFALRETCKTLQLLTRQRVVWMAALRRVCLDNSLFLPSFPVLDMSDVELESAAMAPYMWIELCVALEKQHPNDPDAKLRPRTTRIIEDSLATAGYPDLFIIPGGRYMVSYSSHGISIWDLGYTSSADCKLIASTGPEGESDDCLVQATPDGLGLVILSSRQYKHCSVYEIYPQSETPHLNQIAHLDFDLTEEFPTYLLPDRVIWRGFREDWIVFRVWDYRTNHSISFSADVDLKKFEYNVKVIATKTAIIILCLEEILIWAIPPLSLQSPDFFDYNPTHIPSLFRIAFPDGIVRRTEFAQWHMMSHWYCGSSQPLYFDILCRDAKLHRFEIIVKSDLFDTSLRIINAELVSHHFDDINFRRYSVYGDPPVASEPYDPGQFGAYTSSRFTTVISHDAPAAKALLPHTFGAFGFSLCPASGRYVHLDHGIRGIFVVDFF